MQISEIDPGDDRVHRREPVGRQRGRARGGADIRHQPDRDVPGAGSVQGSNGFFQILHGLGYEPGRVDAADAPEQCIIGADPDEEQGGLRGKARLAGRDKPGEIRDLRLSVA